MRSPVDRCPLPVPLTAGAHEAGTGFCFLEACAWYVGEPHTAHPVSVSPLLAALGRMANDWYGDGPRQELLRLVPRWVQTGPHGSADFPKDERNRRAALFDFTLRRFVPVACARIGQTPAARPFVALPVLLLEEEQGESALLYAARQTPALQPLAGLFEGLQGARELLAFEDDAGALETAVLRCFDAINLSEAPHPTYTPAALALGDALQVLVRPVRTKRGWVAEA